MIPKARPRYLLLEAATPRHQHEWQVFRSIKLPEDKLLVPGVIDVTSNYVEHPQLVADRLVQFAKIVGREQLIASTDSGFAAFAGDRMVDPRIASKKLESLVMGAEIGTRAFGAASDGARQHEIIITCNVPRRITEDLSGA